MDSYIFNNNNTNDGSFRILTTDSSSTSTVIPVLTVGDYEFPTTIGLNNQVLVANTATGMLDWATQSGGGGDITNGGQAGVVNIGSNDNVLTLQGSQGVQIVGGVEFQYDVVDLTSASFNLTTGHYFVEVTGSGNNTIVLPEADLISGQQFIISKGYVGGSLLVSTQTADKIDGDDDITLTILNQRLQVISSGVDRWLLI